MDGLWYKRCPCCSNYLSKRDPLEVGTCYVCNWMDASPPFYCYLRHRYCTVLAESELEEHYAVSPH
jgi:hypothetical protein